MSSLLLTNPRDYTIDDFSGEALHDSQWNIFDRNTLKVFGEKVGSLSDDKKVRLLAALNTLRQHPIDPNLRIVVETRHWKPIADVQNTILYYLIHLLTEPFGYRGDDENDHKAMLGKPFRGRNYGPSLDYGETVTPEERRVLYSKIKDHGFKRDFGNGEYDYYKLDLLQSLDLSEQADRLFIQSALASKYYLDIGFKHKVKQRMNNSAQDFDDDTIRQYA